MRNELRDAAIVEVRSRIVDACLKQARLPEGMPLDVLINGTLVAHGEVVVVNEKFGIRLTDVISAQERVRKLR